MTSWVTDDFVDCFVRLPQRVRDLARRTYRTWRLNPAHPGLRFKRVHAAEPIYSVRVGRGWRTLGLKDGDVVTWFWIGSHAEYDDVLKRL